MGKIKKMKTAKKTPNAFVLLMVISSFGKWLMVLSRSPAARIRKKGEIFLDQMMNSDGST
jgi:hypothetical protein